MYHTDQSLSNKHCQQNNRKRALNVAITRDTLTQNLATRGRKCDDTHQYCSNTNGCFYPGKPVASKQPTCVESEREVNKVNGRLTETVRDWRHDGRHHSPHHAPPFHSPRDKSHALRPPEALRTLLVASKGAGGAAQLPHSARLVSSAMKASSASARSINCRSAAPIRLAASSPSKSLMSFVTSVMKPRTSLRASRG